MPGELKKMKIQAVDENDISIVLEKDGRKLIYFALVNPDTYKITHQVVYNSNCPPQGASGQDLQYSHTNPANLQFDFLFDSTGVIPKPLEGLAGALSGIPIAGAIASALSDLPKYNIFDEIDAFKDIVLTYAGDIHQPRRVLLVWGTLYFIARLTSLEFNYKLFNPDGTPIRVVATAAFAGTVEDRLRDALNKPSSPDLTHIRKVGEGDTLPLMAYRIYGDASYYLEVARVNKLVNFRNLKPGDEIFFPPINKSK